MTKTIASRLIDPGARNYVPLHQQVAFEQGDLPHTLVSNASDAFDKIL